MKSLMDLCQRNNVVDTYKVVTSRLSSHFNIVPDNDKKNCIKKTKLDSFIQRMIVRVHHHISIKIII